LTCPRPPRRAPCGRDRHLRQCNWTRQVDDRGAIIRHCRKSWRTVCFGLMSESTRGQASLYSILLPRDRYGGCIPQSLRWRVLDPHTGQAQAADLGYVVGCTGLTREEDWGSGGGAGMLVFQRRPRRVDVVPAWLNGGDRADRLPPTRRARRCGARTRSGKPCRSPATTKGRCRLHGGASGSGGPAGVRNGQYRHGERTKAAIAERQKFSALLKMLRAGLT
jgi:hypothetical protein